VCRLARESWGQSLSPLNIKSLSRASHAHKMA
jgi:hypothetical protein